ncbi:N-acyl-D-amino-acid deacylase family protein [Natranaerobius thermophilus]|uniref:Amidohydrolase 3 n=1 Tax=Natranaerobius thermophilus (strain ATCC BAA-1301 / DSM 18059 / JW/NM-WN-LF) TaxID=457570 RepID=B2A2T5_NATTJ|nr:D-aminoacylase [Natranaerobius thermophilus]ACB86303.1 Amidohydrolase 3 [Natranaerobius thermophilus JW/NM-WN-LF]
MFDIIICNGKIIDGTGSPWFYGDIAVKDNEIAAIGDLHQKEASEIIDAQGKVIAPGFIDIHSHSDDKFLKDIRAEGKLRQGVTTEVMGQCGNSIAPLQGPNRDIVVDELKKEGIKACWESFSEYFNLLQKRGLPVNVVGVVGHGTLRKQVMGYEARQATEQELSRMKEILASALNDGAFGMSSGLIYPPGSYADDHELIELLTIVSNYNGIYMTHMENEGDRLIDSLNNTIKVAESAGVKVQISHHKAVGRSNWGKVSKTLALVDKARQTGVDITMDQYPYTATSTGLVSLLPQEILEGGRRACLERLTRKEKREKLKKYLRESFEQDRKWSDILIARVKTNHNKDLEGRTISDIASDWKRDPEEVVMNILVEEELHCQMIAFSMSEDDVKKVMKSPYVMIGSDGSSLSTKGPLSEGRPHPRNFGTFPRVIGKYARDEKVLSLEEAIWKMTGFPATRLGLYNRGLLRPGFYADIVVFDQDKIKDMANFDNPCQYPVGIDEIFINGQRVLQKGRYNGSLPGQVLKAKSALK